MAHSHGHGHGHHHAHGHFDHGIDTHKRANRAFAVAVALTFAYTLFEIIYAFIAGSMSLLADAIHNLGDVLGLGLAWGANWMLSLPARRRYSYGFKRTTIIAALINACILVATSALIAYEAIYKLFHLATLNEDVVIVVGIIGIFVNGGTSLLFMRGAQHDINIKGAFLHLLADALILAGVVIAAIIIKYTDLLWLDPALALIIVGIVLWGTWGLLRDSVRLILDAVPHYIDQSGVKAFLLEIPGVTTIHDLHIWGLSTREAALTVHLIMPKESLSDADYQRINKELKNRFKIDHVTIQVEKGSSEISCEQDERC